MKSTYLIALSILAANGVAASIEDLASALSTLKSNVDETDKQVKDYSSKEGIGGAVQIQTQQNKVKSAIENVRNKAQKLDKLSEDDAKSLVSGSKPAVDSVVKLLGDISDKYSDFDEVGAVSIINRNLRDMQERTNNFEEALYARTPCEAMDEVSKMLDSINSAFAKTNKKYNNPDKRDPPSAPSCSSSYDATAAAASTGSFSTSSTEKSDTTNITKSNTKATGSASSAGSTKSKSKTNSKTSSSDATSSSSATSFASGSASETGATTTGSENNGNSQTVNVILALAGGVMAGLV